MQKSQSMGQTFYTNESAAVSGGCNVAADASSIDKTNIQNEYYGNSNESSIANLRSVAAPTPVRLDEQNIEQHYHHSILSGGQKLLPSSQRRLPMSLDRRSHNALKTNSMSSGIGRVHQNRYNYSLAPSKVFMRNNTGNFPKIDSEMDKQQMQKIREEREAQLMSQNIAARILAQKSVKYFSVAATMKRAPRRLEKLNI